MHWSAPHTMAYSSHLKAVSFQYRLQHSANRVVVLALAQQEFRQTSTLLAPPGEVLRFHNHEH